MNAELLQKNKRKEKLVSYIFFMLLFMGFYIFFKYVHPIVPWDGDDWATLGPFITSSDSGIPFLGAYQRILPNIIGTIAGYIAAFVLYPITGDYIGSIVTVNSLIISASVLISLVMIYHICKIIVKDKNRNCLIGVLFFVLIGFLIFKTNYQSSYLYWQYNLCTVYYYSVPSYLASAYIIVLMINRLSIPEEKRKLMYEGVSVAIAYFLVFSFVPAATLVAATVFWYVIDDFILYKNIAKTIKNNVKYIVVLLFYSISLYLEFGRTFGTGYFSSDVKLVDGLKVSLQTILGSFLKTHPIVQVVSILIIICVAITLRMKKIGGKICDIDKTYIKVVFMLLRITFIVFCYSALFGAASLEHIVREGIPLRMDTMYVFYFPIICIIVLSLVYLLENCKRMMAVLPLMLAVFIWPIISPKYEYRESIYTDSTAEQRYEIMTKIVEEVQLRDENGDVYIRVHVPYSIYGGAMSNVLYYHNIVKNQCSIEIVYDTENPFFIEEVKL